MTNYISKINANNTTYTIGGDNFDGQWIIGGGTVLSDATLSSKTYYYYNLSNLGLLPNEPTEDNYAYEVIFAGTTTSGSKSGNTCQLVLYSGVANQENNGWRLNRCTARTDANVRAGGTALIPIFETRSGTTYSKFFTIYTEDSSTNNVNTYLNVVAYRRIGRNIGTNVLYAWQMVGFSDIVYSKTATPNSNEKCLNKHGNPISSTSGYWYFVYNSGTYFVGYYNGSSYSTNHPLTRRSDLDITFNKVRNINGRNIGGNQFNGKLTSFTWFSSDQSSLINTGSYEHNLITNNTTISASGTATYSVSSYIPNDGYDYEICISAYVSTASTSGNYYYLMVNSGNTVDRSLGQVLGSRRARNNGKYRSYQTVWIPIKASNKYIALSNNGTGTATYNLQMHGYRRIGTNSYNTSTGSYGTNIVKNINSYIIGGFYFDDDWILQSAVLASDVTYGANSATTYDLSNVLPNDSSDYMVSFSGYGRTLTSSSTAEYKLMAGTHTRDEVMKYGTRLMFADYHSTSSYACSGNLMMPIFSDRKVTLANVSSNATGNSGLWVCAYRRIGTNT